jgi:hypothetical protein
LFDENSATSKIKEINKSLNQKNYPAIPERIRGLTDNKKEVE